MTAFALLLSLAAAGAAPPCAPSAATVSCLAGQWVGTFGQVDWIIELRAADGYWAGRFRTPQTSDWKPLDAVAVKGEAVSFVIPSHPALTFSLKLAPSRDRLAGTLDVGGLATLPFTAERR